MLEKLQYVNHVNETFDFGKNGVYVQTDDLHDYAWNVTKKNDRITGIAYTTTTKKLVAVIKCSTDAEGIAARNKLLEITEKDVLALQYGKIIIGDYYMRCYVTASSKTDYLINKQYMVATLTITTDLPYWIKETAFNFVGQEDTEDTSGGLDYPFDYPHDYHNSVSSRSIKNTGFMATNFRMVINGACINPAVYVGGHLYQVNCTVAADQHLIIDSVNKTIKLIDKDGTETNVFNSRNKASYVFEKILAGQSMVSWPGNFAFSIVLLEERSEPKWT